MQPLYLMESIRIRILALRLIIIIVSGARFTKNAFLVSYHLLHNNKKSLLKNISDIFLVNLKYYDFPYSLSDIHVLWWILILNMATDSDMKSVFVQVGFLCSQICQALRESPQHV